MSILTSPELWTGTPIALATTLFLRYIYYRYTSPIANAPLAQADNFWLANFGLVPPPDDTEETDKLSEFLIRVGQDAEQSPVSVCWSIMGSPLVLVNSLQGVKDVLVDGQVRPKERGQLPNVQRGKLIQFIQCVVFGGKNINNTIGDEWRWRRHVLLPPFQPRQLVPNLLPYVAKRTGLLLSLFDTHAKQGTALELDETFMNLTMDVINYYLYGRSDLNYDLVGGRSNLKNEHHKLGLGFMSIQAWLPFGLNKTRWAQKTFGEARERLKEFIRDSIERALQNDEAQNGKDDGEERTFHSVTAAAVASGKYNEDRVDLVNDLLSLTFAGYDTTAHTLAFCFSEIARNPEVQSKLFEQVRSVLGPPPLDPASITADKLSKLTYVSAVYRETLRKYPAVVFIPAHVNHDTMVDGTVVPAGAEVWCNVRGIQMNPAIFPNPEKFDPSRWLRPDDEDVGYDSFSAGQLSGIQTVTPDTQYNFPDISFTLGNHACLGKNLAILELRTVIACTVNQFTLSLKPGNVIDTKVVLTTKPRHGVWAHFEERS